MGVQAHRGQGRVARLVPRNLRWVLAARSKARDGAGILCFHAHSSYWLGGLGPRQRVAPPSLSTMVGNWGVGWLVGWLEAQVSGCEREGSKRLPVGRHLRRLNSRGFQPVTSSDYATFRFHGMAPRCGICDLSGRLPTLSGSRRRELNGFLVCWFSVFIYLVFFFAFSFAYFYHVSLLRASHFADLLWLPSACLSLLSLQGLAPILFACARVTDGSVTESMTVLS